jgi:hypothetical protein
MQRVETYILAAIAFPALIGVLACNDNDRDEHQGAASKAATSQQATPQKPAEKPNVEEEEEGAEVRVYRAE